MSGAEETRRPRWAWWEWGALTLTIGLLVLYAAWPILRGPALAPPDGEFLGLGVGARDGHFYASLIAQRPGASPLLRNPYAEPGQDRIYWGVFWWALAHVRQVTGASPVGVLNGARLVATVGCGLAVAGFATVMTRTRAERWLAIQLAVWGGGLGWLVGMTGWHDYRSADLLTPELSLWYTVLSFPHVAGALALLVGAFAAVWVAFERQTRAPWGWMAGVMAAALGVIHPFNVLVLLLAWGLFAGLLWRWQPARFPVWLRCSAPLVVGGVVPVLYFTLVLLLYPIGLPETVVRRPAYGDLVLGLGILGFGGVVYAVLLTWRRAWEWSIAWGAMWIVATLLLLHSYPVLKQEGRAILGLHVPFAVWTALAVLRGLCPRGRGMRAIAGALVVLCAAPTAGFVLRDRVQRFTLFPSRFYLRRAEAGAMPDFAGRLTADDLVACSAWNGLVLGARVPARLFWGKWDEPTAAAHEQILAELFAPDTPAPVRRMLVARHGITALWIAEAERGTYSDAGLQAAVRDLATDVLVNRDGVLAVRVGAPPVP